MAPLSGGLTNQNYLVTDGGTSGTWCGSPESSTELLAIDRVNERHNAQAAATTGISPRIVEYLEDWSVMVLEYIDGETMSGERLREAAMPARIAASLHRLHAGPPFLKDFDMFRITESYLESRRSERTMPDPRRVPRSDDDGRGGRARACRQRPATVPCHNDLLAENYIDDGRQLWMIDFEYSGNNDPMLRAGRYRAGVRVRRAARAALCAAYFGRHDRISSRGWSCTR